MMNREMPVLVLNRSAFILMAMLFVLPQDILAALEASASLSSTQVETGETFQLSVQVVGDENSGDLPWPEVGGLEPFEVNKTSGTSTSSHITIIQGKREHKTQYVTTFTFNLTPKRAGEFTLGPVRYVHGDFSKELGTARIKVSKAEAGLELMPSLGKGKAYVGEQVLYQLRIIPDPSVQNIRPPNFRHFRQVIGEKFWMQDLDKEIQPKVVKIGGVDTRVYDIRIAMFPLLSGNIALEGVSVEYQQVKSRRRSPSGSVFDLFDDGFFGGRVVNLTAESRSLDLDVLPLPNGHPEGFSGAVGNYQVSAQVDRRELPSGEAMTLTVTIEGDGQPKSIQDPILPDLGAFEVFDPEASSSTQVRNGRLWTEKTLKYVMIPRKRGEYVVGPIRYPFFHPGNSRYQLASTDSIRIQVTEGKELATSSRVLLSKNEIAEIGSDIRHIKTSGPLEQQGSFLHRQIRFWLLFPIPPFLFLCLALYRRHSHRLESDAALRRKSRAGAALRQRLKDARKAQQGNDARDFYRHLSLAINGFLSDKCNTEFRGLTLQEAKAKLETLALGDGLADEYEQILTHCDYGQFAAGAKNPEEWKEWMHRTEALLNRLEKKLR